MDEHVTFVKKTYLIIISCIIIAILSFYAEDLAFLEIYGARVWSTGVGSVCGSCDFIIMKGVESVLLAVIVNTVASS